MDESTYLCRLCALPKTNEEIIAEIDDVALCIKQKLIDCCRWNELEQLANEKFPTNVCITCLQLLEQSYEFTEFVAESQQRLMEIIEQQASVSGYDPQDFELDVKPFDLEAISNREIDHESNEDMHNASQSYGEIVIDKELIIPLVKCDDLVKYYADKNRKAKIQENYSSKRAAKTSAKWMNAVNGHFERSIATNHNVKTERKNDLIEPFPAKQPRLIEAKQEANDSYEAIVEEFIEDDDSNSVDKVEEIKVFEYEPENEQNTSSQPDFNHELVYKEEPAHVEQIADAPKSKRKKKMRLNISKPTNPVKSFLKLLNVDDLNEDGTINSKRITELDLDSWMVLQHQCFICGEITVDYDRLKTHFAAEHPNEKMRHLCSLCTKSKTTYCRRHVLLRHIIKSHHLHLTHWSVNQNSSLLVLKIHNLKFSLFFAVATNVTHFIGTFRNCKSISHPIVKFRRIGRGYVICAAKRFKIIPLSKCTQTRMLHPESNEYSNATYARRW